MPQDQGHTFFERFSWVVSVGFYRQEELEQLETFGGVFIQKDCDNFGAGGVEARNWHVVTPR